MRNVPSMLQLHIDGKDVPAADGNTFAVVNPATDVETASPWGGRKDSGLGSKNGVEAYRSHTRAKSAVINTADHPFDWFGSTNAVRYS